MENLQEKLRTLWEAEATDEEVFKEVHQYLLEHTRPLAERLHIREVALYTFEEDPEFFSDPEREQDDQNLIRDTKRDDLAEISKQHLIGPCMEAKKRIEMRKQLREYNRDPLPFEAILIKEDGYTSSLYLPIAAEHYLDDPDFDEETTVIPDSKGVILNLNENTFSPEKQLGYIGKLVDYFVKEIKKISSRTIVTHYEGLLKFKITGNHDHLKRTFKKEETDFSKSALHISYELVAPTPIPWRAYDNLF